MHKWTTMIPLLIVIGFSRFAQADDPPKPDSQRRAATAGQSTRPNFLFVLGDDITYNDLPAYGGRNITTPNIDRLAREGMRFTRAYCAMSMCAPFRAELYTGHYPVRNGVAWNHSIARPGMKSICHYLRDLGYRVGIAGKTHVKPPSVFPFDAVKDFPAGPGVRDYLAKRPGRNQIRATARKPSSRSRWSLKSAQDAKLRTDSSVKEAKQPFCLFLCSHNAHPPWRSGDASTLDRDVVALPPVLHDNPPTRDTYTRYLAEIVALDDEVGQVLQLLEETGQADNTLVMFCSEQGWDFAFGKWTNWDLGVRSALIARWPGRVRPGTQTDALIQIADIVPTFIAAAGGDPATYKLDGISFLSVLRGESNAHRRYVYGLHNNVPEGNPYPIRSIRDDQFHYLHNLLSGEPYHEKHLMTEGLAKRYDLDWWQALHEAAAQDDASAKKLYGKYHHRPAEELYRVDEDPWEMNNLADKPEYAEAKRRLRAELHRWMAEQGDPGAAMDDPAVHAANRATGQKKAPQNKQPAQ